MEGRNQISPPRSLSLPSLPSSSVLSMPLFSSSSSKPPPSKPTPTSQSPYPPAHTLPQHPPASPHGGQFQQTTMQYQQPYPPQTSYQNTTSSSSSEPPLRTWFDAVDLDRYARPSFSILSPSTKLTFDRCSFKDLDSLLK